LKSARFESALQLFDDSGVAVFVTPFALISDDFGIAPTEQDCELTAARSVLAALADVPFPLQAKAVETPDISSKIIAIPIDFLMIASDLFLELNIIITIIIQYING